MAFLSDDQILAMSFAQYSEFLQENPPVTGTPEAEMVSRVGNNIRGAAEKWYESLGESDYLRHYRWEYQLVNSDEVNAWCMPGGKIVVFTGILPVTETEDGLAAVMGHEVAHALLNHGKQRISASLLRELGEVGVSLFTDNQLVMAAYNVGSTLGATLPFSRSHESESDKYGLTLMTIAGYDPNEAVSFWQRMDALSSDSLDLSFLSTHPSHSARINDLQGWIPEARQKAAEFAQ